MEPKQYAHMTLVVEVLEATPLADSIVYKVKPESSKLDRILFMEVRDGKVVNWGVSDD